MSLRGKFSVLCSTRKGAFEAFASDNVTLYRHHVQSVKYVMWTSIGASSGGFEPVGLAPFSELAG